MTHRYLSHSSVGHGPLSLNKFITLPFSPLNFNSFKQPIFSTLLLTKEKLLSLKLMASLSFLKLFALQVTFSLILNNFKLFTPFVYLLSKN